MEIREKVFERLHKLGIKYKLVEHEAVYTLDEMAALGLFDGVNICKNLFVRNGKGDRHYLVVTDSHSPVNLKALAETLKESRLSFASEERLSKYLGLKKGEVTPLAVLNDEERAVRVVFDENLVGKPFIGVHPNDNTATVILSFEDIEKYVSDNGNGIIRISLG